MQRVDCPLLGSERHKILFGLGYVDCVFGCGESEGAMCEKLMKNNMLMMVECTCAICAVCPGQG